MSYGAVRSLPAALFVVGILFMLLPSSAFAATVTLRPSGSGNYTEYDSQYPSVGSHWDKVDEASADEDSTYIEDNDDQDRDLFDLPASGIAGGSTINSVTVWARGRRIDLGADIQIGFRDGVNLTDNWGSSVGLTGSYANYSRAMSANPVTGSAWTLTEVDSLQIGVRHVSAWDVERVTQVYAVIDYTPLGPPTVTDFNAADGELRQSTLTWTNPDPAANDLAEVMVMRKQGSYPTDHTDGTLVYHDLSPVEGQAINYVDTGLNDLTAYYYAVFSKDDGGQWNDSVDSVAPDVNADTATTKGPGTGNGRLVYGEGTQIAPRTRTYTLGAPGSWSSETSLNNADDRIQWAIIESDPTREEKLIGTLSDNSGSGSELHIQRDDTGTVTSEWNVVTTSDQNWARTRTFDIAYEQSSGDAIVAYSKKSDDVFYRTWDGTAWSSEQSFNPTSTNGNVQWIELVSRPNSDEILLVWSDAVSNISARVWSGSSWNSEPSSALTTSMAYDNNPGDQKAFDAAWESSTGEFLIVWGENGASPEYITGTSGSWGSLNTDISGSWSREATIMSATAEPGGDRIVVSGHDESLDSLGQAIWTGSAWTSVQNDMGQEMSRLTENSQGAQQTNDTGWLVSGGNARALVVWAGRNRTDIRYNYWDGSGWNNNSSFSPSPGISEQSNILLRMRPDDASELMAFFSDQNEDLNAKEVTFDGSSISWADTEGGSDLETQLSAVNNYRTQAFDFDFDRFLPAPSATIVGDGNSPSNKTVGPSNTTQTVSAFTLETSTGVDAVTEIQVTGINTANVASSGVKVWEDNGSTPNEWDSGDTQINGGVSFSGGVATFSGLSVSVDSSATQYVITYDIAASPTHGATMTGLVTSATASNPVTLNDTADATLTIDAQAPPTVTDFNASDGDDEQVNLTWTNPDTVDDDLGAVVIRRKTGSYPADHLDGTLVAQDLSPDEGVAQLETDTGLTNGQIYYYAVFSRDIYGNWNDAVDSTPPNINADTGTPSDSVTIGDGNNPADKTVGPGATTRTVSSFTLKVGTESDTVTGLEITGTNTANVAANGVRVWYDIGTTSHEWDTDDVPVGGPVSFSGATAIFTGLDIGVTTMEKEYIVTYDIAASPAHGATLTGYVTSATVTKPLNNFDTPDATLTIDAQAPPAVADFAASDGEEGQSTLTWANPDPTDNDLVEVVVMRTTGSYSADHTDGTQVYQDTSPTEGGAVNYVDTGLTAGQTYYYAVFSKDVYGNWNDTVDSTAPNMNADTGTPQASGTVTVYPTSVAPASVYQGDTDVAMARFYLLADTGTAQWTDVRVDLGGTGAAPADVETVKIYASGDTNFSPSTDTLIGSGPVGGSGFAQIDIDDQAIAVGISNYYFVVYDVAGDADASHTLTAKLQTPGATYFTISAPDSMADTNLPFETSPETVINEIVSTLTAVDTAPASIEQGDVDDFLRFTMTTNVSTSTLESITIDQLGTVAPGNVVEVAIWRSADASFNPGSDTKIGTGSFLPSATITGLSETITPSATNYYFVTIEIEGRADYTNTIGARIPANGFTVSSGSVSNSQTDSSIIPITEAPAGDVDVYHWNQAPRGAPKPQPGRTRTIATQKLAFAHGSEGTTLTAVGIAKQGDLADSAVDEVRLYKSSDGSFEESGDTVVAAGVFSSGSTTLTLSPPAAVSDAVTDYYYVVLVLNDTADIGDTVGTLIANESDVIVEAPATVKPFSNLKSYLITLVGEPHGSPNNPGAFANTSLCGTCHTVHLAPTSKRILQKVFTKDPEFVNNNPAAKYVELCFSCHDGSGSSVNIKQHYEADGANAGHSIDYTGDAAKAVTYGYPAGGITYNKGTQLPCLICHDVHQSRNGNYKMLADELYEYASDPSQNAGTGSWDSSPTLWSSSSSTDKATRQRCEVCHRSADGMPHSSETTQNGTGGFADDKSVIVGIDVARPGSHADPPQDTQACYGAGGCHLNPHNPGTGESPGGFACSACHQFFEDMNAGTATYHHYMQNDGATTLTSSNSKYPTKNLFGAGDAEAEERRCLTCHADHDIFSPQSNPAGIRASNLRIDVTTIPVSMADTTNTDFVPSAAKGGICLSCHENSQTKSTTRAVDGSSKTLVVTKDEFANSAHQYTQEPTSTFRSDGSTFKPNCAKCHNTMVAAKESGSKQNSTYKFELHDHPYRRLLAVLGISSPSDPLEENFCYGCHSGATAGNDYYGGQSMSAEARSIKSVFTSKARIHPIGTAATTRHIAVEGESANWNPKTDRHVECEDCHNPHGAKAGTHNVGEAEVSTDKDHGAKIGGPNVGVWGVKPSYSLYNTGTASFTNGSKTVTGSGTSWSSTLQSGWFIKNTWDMAGRWYKIDTVDSNTGLTLVTNYNSAHSDPDGVTRISGVAYVASGVTYTRTSSAEHEYEVCLKCHSEYAFGDSPPNTPSGHADGTTIEETNVGHDFNTEQFAIHPVTGLGKNQPIAVNGTGANQYSAWNSNWPNFNTGSVTINTAAPTVASFTSAFPTTVIPGWYLKYGTTSPSSGSQNGWYQVTKVINSTSLEVTPTPSSQQGPGSFSLTAGLGNAFVAPWGPWSRMVCSDCHASNSASDPEGPHGSSRKWINTEADPDISFSWWYNNTVYTVTPNKNMRVNQNSDTNQPLTATPVIFCYNCHRRDVYGDLDQDGQLADNPDIPGAFTSLQNRVSHDISANSKTYSSTGGWGSGGDVGNRWGEAPGVLCMMCHGGDSLGGFHGTSAKVGVGGSNNQGERFLNGATWEGVTRATTSQTVKCWTKSNTDEVNYCNKGHAGSGGRSANYNWP